jgi:hypothetical protein
MFHPTTIESQIGSAAIELGLPMIDFFRGEFRSGGASLFQANALPFRPKAGTKPHAENVA